MFFVDSLYQQGGVYSLPAGVVAEFCPLTPIGAWGGGVIAGVLIPSTSRKVSSLPAGVVAEFCPLTPIGAWGGGVIAGVLIPSTSRKVSSLPAGVVAEFCPLPLSCLLDRGVGLLLAVCSVIPSGKEFSLPPQ